MDDTDYALGRTDAEYQRLIEQAELFRPLTERMLRAAGIGAGMHVLDIGCGMGDVSFLVSELVGPQGSVVGVDLDRDVLRHAEERRNARAITNVVFRETDARYLDSQHLFDAAVGRFVLVYMSDPTAHGHGRRFPALYDLVGFTGSGLSHVAWKNFSENVPERAARLIHERKMGPQSSSFPTASRHPGATST